MSNSKEPFQPSYSSCDEVTPACPIEATLYGYRPTLGATALFAAIFALNLIVTLVFMVRSRLWSFQAWLSVGLIFEIIGYTGRLMMYQDPWNPTTMSMQLACLFIGPSFVSAAISVVFKHIILYCGQQHSKLKAKWYPYVFIGTDFACILVQVAGGAISSLATTGDGSNMALLDAGSGLLIAGVAAQVVNMVGCGIIILHFIYSYRRSTTGPSKQEATDTSQYTADKTNPKLRRNFNAFCWALFVAYVAVLIRCIYRIPEMAMGWGSTLMQNETSFLILDGAMIAIAVSLLTLAYPGLWFPPMRRNKKQAPPATQEAGIMQG